MLPGDLGIARRSVGVAFDYVIRFTLLVSHFRLTEGLLGRLEPQRSGLCRFRVLDSRLDFLARG